MSTMAEHTEVLDASPERCFDTVAAFETYPEWMPAYTEVKVLERDAEGRPLLVEYNLDAKIKQVRYVLRHSLQRPTSIGWDYVQGDARSVDGGWEFADAGEGRTRATHRVSFDVGGFVPGSVKKALAEQAVQSSLRAVARRLQSESA